MEWLSGFFQANIGSLLIIGLVILVFFILVKTGKFNLNVKGVQIGEDQNTRNLIRNMWEYSDAACEAQFSKIRNYCMSDEHAKYLICRVQDVLQKAIVYNYMEESESYVRAKQAMVLNTIQKRVTDPHFFTPEFKSCCDRFVENLIRDLVRMKRINK